MARYIDVDALLRRLPDDLPYKASVKRVLIQAPTADVAPRADVARELFEEIKAMPIAKDFTRKSQDFEFGYRLATQEILAELRKKYESERADKVKWFRQEPCPMTPEQFNEIYNDESE